MTASQVPPKKEAAVLSDESLKALAGELAEGTTGLRVAMYLNIPTSTLVNMELKANEKQTLGTDRTLTMLYYWKTMRATAKEKDKVLDLERAMREAGKQEVADVILDRHRDNMELTTDCFPQQ